MAKRNTNKQKRPYSTDQSPNTKGKVVRKAGFWVKEILTPSGEKSVDIDCMNSQVRDYGRLGMFDTVFLMIKSQIVDQVENMKESIPNAIKWHEQREDKLTSMAMENFHLKQQLEEVRQLAMNIQTGRGGNKTKSDPYETRKGLLAILKGGQQ